MRRQIIGIVKFDKGAWQEFYMGNFYPLAVAFIVALGSVTGLEYYLNFINTALVIGALLICPSIKPVIITVCTYVYQISLVNSPFYPGYSDYYVSSWRLPVSLILAVLIVGVFIFYVIKNRIYKRVSFEKSPLLLPIMLFSAALLLNGMFSGQWRASNLVFGGAHVIVYLFVFLLFYHGLENESAEETVKYFAYISLLISAIIGIEMLNLFISSDNIIVDGSINKVEVALGWGIWNLIGVSAAVLIPTCFLGMQICRFPWLYFAGATVAFISAALTMSRNALLFATLAYALCVAISCFFGKHKKAMRIVAAVGIILLLCVFFAAKDKILLMLKDFLDRGFSDNGRFKLWLAAFDNFIKAPMFGSGFYSLSVEGQAVFGPLPIMAHNTVMELLSAMGIFGLFAYAYYRIKSLKPFFVKPSLTKTFLGISVLVILFESLLDNFIFNVYPMFYVMAAMAVVFKLSEEKEI